MTEFEKNIIRLLLQREISLRKKKAIKLWSADLRQGLDE